MRSYKQELLTTTQRLKNQTRISAVLLIINLVIVVVAWYAIIDTIDCKG